MLASSAVVVVGCGVAGLVAAYEAARSGAHVVVVDKASRCGGNSAKASSGLSAARTQGAAVDSFMADTLRSGGGDPALVQKLTTESPGVLEYLQVRNARVDLVFVSFFFQREIGATPESSLF
jgi:succinate dehydrogenase/fumarate reductase flavoprotein subunit